MDTNQITERFNQIAKKYDEQRRLFIPCFDDYYGFGVSFVKSVKKEARRILDLGAGTGLLTKYLFDLYPDADYTLADVSEKMLEVSRERFAGLSHFDFLILDYSKELPEGRFDLIVSALSIHHLEDEDKLSLYANIYDKLTDGGYFLNLDQFNASSPAMNELYNNFWYESIEASGISPEAKASWLQRKTLDRENTIDESKSLLAKAGFKNVECIYNYLKFGVLLAIK
ncbi:MAG: class I SAM-dependent methyltransferase [Fibrobacter sp.]|jgi:ubiquinone/menaquinone biosynthesis C-methylase UbiE|nr:class I SAM-dependent methyltransferase [Fibrobacter sp.]